MSEEYKYNVGNTTSCYCPNCPPESEPYKIYYMDKIEMRDAEGKWHTFPVWCSGVTVESFFPPVTFTNTAQYLILNGNITVDDVGYCLSCDPSRPLDPYFIYPSNDGVAHGSTMPEWKQKKIRANHREKQMRKYQDMSGQCLCCNGVDEE